jgi:predicted dehydrogenase
MLKGMGERELVDELRVTMWEESGTTAYFTFSSQMRPVVNQFRVYGPRNGLVLDQENETLVLLRGTKYKSYAEHFVSPLVLAKQYVGNTARNACKFLHNDFHMRSGMRCLIEAFYQSIRDGGPPPIPHSEILRTSRILDEIFRQLEMKAPKMPAERVLEDQLSPTETGIPS